MLHRRMHLTLLLTGLLYAAAAWPSLAAAQPQATAKPASPAAMVTITDPVEGSFSVQMPKGWRNQAYLVRVYDQVRTVGTSLSPDGKTLLFYGDPRLPSYIVPTPFMDENNPLANMNPIVKTEPFVPAEPYFTRYVRNKFGKLPGFRITGTAPNPGTARVIETVLRRGGLAAQIDAVRITFDYKDNGKPMHALINGATFTNGTVWLPDVSGIATTGDPARYSGLLLRIADSHRTNPQWKAKQQALHEQRMAQLRQDYENQMASWNASNQRHQMRMQAIQAAGDASMQRWYQSQAQSDASHKRFINFITDEHTVVGSGGKTYQVDNSHERYFVHKRDNTYIGTNSTTDLDDLRGKIGINPDDYEEVKIKY